MGKRGPKPTPTAILAARGSWRAKTRQGEPQADGTPTPPAWLTGDARAAWDALIPRLASMGIVGEADTFALARYVTLLTRWRQSDIPSVDEPTLREHPAARIASRLADQLLRLEREFGLTPAARPGGKP